MKKSRILAVLIGLLMLGAGGLSGSVYAADATGAVDFVSAYVWRGITFNDGLVAQPSLDVSSGGFGVNVWGNMDIDDYDDTLESGEFSEVDLTLSYGFSMDPLDVTVGYIEYLFPEAGPDTNTREVFLSLGTEPVAGFSVGVDGYYDFDEVEDYYVNVNVGYAYTLDNGLSVGAGAAAGIMGEDASLGPDGGLHEYLFSVDCSYAVTDALGISAFLAYTDTFDEDVLPEQDTDLFGGAGISYSF